MAGRSDNIKEPVYWSVGNECLKHWRIYAVTSMLSIVIALCFVFFSSKQYSAQTIIVDESAETDILLGLDNWSAWIKQSMPKTTQGLNEPLVYTNILNSDIFAKEISNIYLPTKQQNYFNYIAASHPENTLQYIKKRIKNIVYSRYGTIILQVTDEDPYIAAVLVDSVREHLYYKVLEYRRKNLSVTARNDKNIYQECHDKYEEAKRKYSEYVNSYGFSESESYKSKIENLQRERDLRFEEYKKAVIQYNRSKALSEREVPVFSVVKNTTVPLKASSPNLMGYVLSFLIISIILTTWFILGRRKFCNLRE